jgi:hypothetical protein
MILTYFTNYSMFMPNFLIKFYILDHFIFITYYINSKRIVKLLVLIKISIHLSIYLNKQFVNKNTLNFLSQIILKPFILIFYDTILLYHNFTLLSKLWPYFQKLMQCVYSLSYQFISVYYMTYQNILKHFSYHVLKNKIFHNLYINS